MQQKGMPMNFEDYQAEAIKTAIYPDLMIPSSEIEKDTFVAWVYPLIGLQGEVGEVAEKFKKILRDKDGNLNEQDSDAIVKELGDVLWYLAAICDELGVNLDTVAKKNIQKLNDRRDRNKIHGEGDDR